MIHVIWNIKYHFVQEFVILSINDAFIGRILWKILLFSLALCEGFSYFNILKKLRKFYILSRCSILACIVQLWSIGMFYANATQISVNSLHCAIQEPLYFIALIFCHRLEGTHPSFAAIFQCRQKHRDSWLPADVKPRWVGVARVSHVSIFQIKKGILLCAKF